MISDFIATDLPWRALFDGVTVEERPYSSVHGRARTTVYCWGKSTQVTVPLRVPLPWTATMTLTAPPGCAEVGPMIAETCPPDLEIPDITTADHCRIVGLDLNFMKLKVQQDTYLDGRLVHHREEDLEGFPSRPETWPDGGLAEFYGWSYLNLGLSPWEIQYKRPDGQPQTMFLADGQQLDTLPVFFSRCAPIEYVDLCWNTSYQKFLSDVGIPLSALLARTGQEPYAGLAVSLLVEWERQDGPYEAYLRPAVAAALSQVDPNRLTTDLQRVRGYWMDRYRRQPSGPMVGTATLRIGPTVEEVVVDGRTVLLRDVNADIDKRTLHQRQTITVDVWVPDGEAVWLRTSRRTDNEWEGQGGLLVREAWSVLLPGHTYDLSQGIAKTLGRRCFRVEGAPDGVWFRWPEGDLRWDGRDWMGQTYLAFFHAQIDANEPGAYILQWNEEGSERVRYDPMGCA